MTNLRKTKDAAERLGVSASKLNHDRVAGCGPAFVKVGRRVLYRDEDLDAFIVQNLRQSTTEAA